MRGTPPRLKVFLALLMMLLSFIVCTQISKYGLNYASETTSDLIRMIQDESTRDRVNWLRFTAKAREVLEPNRTRRGIPRIIHQMYKSTTVPQPYHRLMQSWIKYNPTYRYYFWTDSDIRNLIRDHYPEYLRMYDSYKYALQRSDAGRYFILYHYGGIYADADVECVKPFDDYLRSHNTCTIVPEPVEQTLLLWDLDILYTNAIMICQEGHEFLRRVIAGLPISRKRIPDDRDGGFYTVWTTGPLYMKDVLEQYLKNTDKDIYLAPYEELVPISDKEQSRFFKRRCMNRRLMRNKKYKKTCAMLKKLNYYIGNTSRAYSVHHWLHLGYEERFKKVKKMKKSTVENVLKNTTVLRYGTDDHDRRHL